MYRFLKIFYLLILLPSRPETSTLNKNSVFLLTREIGTFRVRINSMSVHDCPV